MCLRCNAGMATWERGFLHEYAGTKSLHHPTTEVVPPVFATLLIMVIAKQWIFLWLRDGIAIIRFMTFFLR